MGCNCGKNNNRRIRKINRCKFCGWPINEYIKHKGNQSIKVRKCIKCHREQ